MAGLPEDLDFVISARPAAAEATLEDLNEEFIRALRRLGKCSAGEPGGGA